MLDKLATLFPEDQMENVSQILASVSNFAKFIDQKVSGDQSKFNEAIEAIKHVFDSYKKQ